MITGIADLYILCLGMLYPAYKMLQVRDEDQTVRPESCLRQEQYGAEREFWQKYFIVFSIAYVSSEVLELSMYILIPFITLAQVIGVSVLVLPKTQTTQSLYDNVLLPFYEKHETLIRQKLEALHI